MAAAAALARAPIPKVDVAVSRAVLVVEDEPFARKATCMALAVHGYSVLWARNVAEATRILDRHASCIATVICDAVLPDGSGITLVQKLHRVLPALRAILVSGYPPALIADKCSGETGAVFMTKPYTCADLISKTGILPKGESARDQVA